MQVPKRLFVIGVAALSVGGGAALANALTTSAGASSGRHFHSASQQGAGGPGSLSQAFGVFRRSTQGQPPLPASVASRWSHITQAGFNGSFGLDPTKAQHVHIAGRDIWLVPGTTGMCVILPSYSPSGAVSYGNIMCGPLDKTLAGRFLVWITDPRGLPAGTQTVIGLVPDANNTISLKTGAGATVNAPVVDNMFTATSASGFRGYQVRDASGAMQTVGDS